MTGPLLKCGYHWFSHCHKVTYSTVRRNAACGCYRDVYKKAGFSVQDGGTAHWAVDAPDLRSYDGIATSPKTGQRAGLNLVVADPSRHCRLSTGSCFFKRGEDAALVVHLAKCAYCAKVHRHWAFAGLGSTVPAIVCLWYRKTGPGA